MGPNSGTGTGSGTVHYRDSPLQDSFETGWSLFFSGSWVVSSPVFSYFAKKVAENTLQHRLTSDLIKIRKTKILKIPEMAIDQNFSVTSRLEPCWRFFYNVHC